ncbi:ribosomal protein S18 acetylase RimI-like enzyme [Actinoplanes lutulentus]|uniref:Acetyltransferase (GNAT) family protein n=1 Tax=Actinoplanes lutulentus TaxID=1287878 RepID=A0A327ZL65_9ACTN|nr:GNAT family N-acetyltransferase [Actinoplanes lutulentus]MBB2941070.1 ribosomal protein S18 acetylase RimI-like enzyme [Actinoplanes lutulentus]RAK43379.1 acetyltransferase (GNAT) family protein [Actinoplanes lutulentus]
MEDDVSIRAASDEDVRKLVDHRDEKHYFLEHLGKGRGILLFAVLGEVLVGHIFLRLEPPEEPELRDGLPGVPLLQHLRVMDEHQRSGIGRRLLSAAEHRLYTLGHRRVALGVHPDNDPAINLYRGLRFSAWRAEHLATFREHVLDDGSTVRVQEPCLVFVKKLDPPNE